MNTHAIVFISLSGVSLILFIISIIKKINLMRIISESILQLGLGAIAVSFLKNYLPDSFHIMIIAGSSFVFSTMAELFFNYSEKKICRISGRILFVISILCWIQLYRTTFYLYHVPVWSNILALSIYIFIFGLVILLCRFSKPKSYFLILVTIAVTAFFHYCGLLTLCYTPCAYSIVLFCGSSILFGLEILYIFQYLRFNFKYATILRSILVLASQAAIGTASVLMIAL